jgi:hypothetical protein
MTIGAVFAGPIKRLTAFAFPAHSRNWKSKPISGPAPTAFQPPKPDGNQPLPNLKARSLMLHNRNGKAASAYERIHTILSEGRK